MNKTAICAAFAAMAMTTSIAVSGAVDDGHTADYAKGRIDVPVKRNDGHTEHYMNRHNSILSKASGLVS